MKEPQKHLNFQKRGLGRCRLTGFAADGALDLRAQEAFACLVTPIFDTGEAGCTYHRLTVDGAFGGARLEVVAAASDREEVQVDGAWMPLEKYLSNPRVRPEEKLAALKSLPHVRAADSTDLLLHGLEGRYVWICLVVRNGRGAVLRGLRLEFPRASFDEYLPEAYQGNPFFRRYLAVFQSLYLDLEREVDRLPARLDYESAREADLRELAGWLGLENSPEVFTAGQLRHLIRHIDRFQGGKGTKAVLEELVELVAGARPRILESFQWEDPRLSPRQREQYRRLYGEGGGRFCVLLEPGGRKLPVERARLEALIESYSVLGASFKLVLLADCCHADTYCYLGVNSRLSVPEAARAGGFTLGSHSTVG